MSNDSYYGGQAKSMYPDMNILESVEQVYDEFIRLQDAYPDALKFEDIEIKLSKDRKLHGLLYLNRLTGKGIGGADHDIIYMSARPADLVGCNIRVIAELYASGIHCYDEDILAMFV